MHARGKARRAETAREHLQAKHNDLPRCRASYPPHVRQACASPSASCSLALNDDTLALWPTLPLARRVEDLHPKAGAPVGPTKKRRARFRALPRCYAYSLLLERLRVAEVRDASITVVQVEVEASTGRIERIDDRILVGHIVNAEREATVPRRRPSTLQIMCGPR